MGINVSFLDVFIEHKNGILSTYVYHKHATEPYVMPFISDHPQHIFRNIIHTALARAVRYSSTFEEFNNERRYIHILQNILISNSENFSSNTICRYHHQLINSFNNTIEITIDKNHPSHLTVKKIWKQPQLSMNDRLIIHVPYVKRLRSLRKDIHQLWSNTFDKTNVIQTKLILGTITRRNIKSELVQRSPAL